MKASGASVTTTRHPLLTTDNLRARMKKRYAAERRFRLICGLAVGAALLFLLLLFGDILRKGYSAFLQTEILFEDLYFDPELLDPAGSGDPEVIGAANFPALWREPLKAQFEPAGRSERRALYGLISGGAEFELRDEVMENPSLVGERSSRWLLASDDVDMLIKGHISRDLPEDDRTISDQEIAWVDQLAAEGRIARKFNTRFFTGGDSRDPEMAGILGAAIGSGITMLVTLALSFPIGVAAAVYLEEFAPKNRLTDLIEVNINNLAAVPSIVFGLLGLAVFLNFFGLPRSAPLVGGMVLSLMTLPTIIIASRTAIKSVPPSIREAAYGLGASPLQVIQHHVLPLAMPGILTGTIIGMAQALGETAPLLMIGMVAFIADLPSGPLDPATVLPVQIFLWSDIPERAFVERTSAAILCLLAFLIGMNAFAVWLRRRTEQRW
ncbi:MAG: phosphate ABC transporter permease PstA [Acidobacteriota bacterium]